MADVIVVAILIVVVGFAIAYIIRAKKRGQKCIGCSNSSSCGNCCHCGK